MLVIVALNFSDDIFLLVDFQSGETSVMVTAVSERNGDSSAKTQTPLLVRELG